MAVRSIMNEILGNIQDRLAAVEDRLDRVEARMGQIETRMGQIETRMGQIETRMDGLSREMVEFRTDVSQQFLALSNRMDHKWTILMRGNEAILQILERMAETNASDGARIRDHEERIKALESQ